jgi:hypothetical protein
MQAPEKFQKYTIEQLNQMLKEWEDHLETGKEVSDIAREYGEFQQKSSNTFLERLKQNLIKNIQDNDGLSSEEKQAKIQDLSQNK